MGVVSDAEKTQPVSVTQYDVVVVGAGPYGLSTAAHLLGKGLKVAVFGKPLELWRNHMPPGMFLRSHWWATNLSDPCKKYTIQRFFAQSQKYKACYPLPIEAFIEYGLWFQKNAVPHVDETYVAAVRHENGSFVLTLEDGRVVHSSAVVVASGVYYYSNRPDEYSGLSRELISHAFDHGHFDGFAGKDIAVIGGGQSAVEYSALLQELGAHVYLLVRRNVQWLSPDRQHERTLLEKIKAPSAGIAPGWRNWVLEYIPYLFYRFPQERKDRYLSTAYGAAASSWLRDRVIGKVDLREGQHVTQLQAVENGKKVELTLSNGERLVVDHVMQSTGYKVDVNYLTMLAPSLIKQVQTDQNIPVLDHYFQSVSVPGLYFVGLSTMRAFGPLYRFVVGVKAAAPRVASSVARRIARVR